MIGCKYPLEAPLQGHFKQTTCSSTSYPYKTIHLICVCTTLEYISAKIHQEIPIEFKFWFFTSTHHTRFLGVLHWFINHERGFTFVFFLITCVANIWCKFCEYLSQKNSGFWHCPVHHHCFCRNVSNHKGLQAPKGSCLWCLLGAVGVEIVFEKSNFIPNEVKHLAIGWRIFGAALFKPEMSVYWLMENPYLIFKPQKKLCYGRNLDPFWSILLIPNRE